MSDPRAVAAGVLARVAGRGQSLDAALAAAGVAASEPLVRELCYGTLRWYPRLEALLDALLARPLRSRDLALRCLLLLGLYQLAHLRVPAHAAVDATVGACRALARDWARGLVNGVLRGYLRRRAELEAALDRSPQARYAHPAWLIERLRTDWPEHYEAVLAAGNRRPPMTLRVNPARGDREAYLAALRAAGIEARAHPRAPQAVTLARPVPVQDLPGFAEGWVSVQDAAAQRAAELLGAEPGERVLDACAAPGGKTAHLLERTPGIAELVALDVDAARMARLEESLQRLALRARPVVGDAAAPADWWDGRPFRRILLDAPCSATGVLRRHPDIKLLRRESDLGALAQRQGALLEALWSLLEPGGILLYATCSVLRQENHAVVREFLGRHADARLVPVADCDHAESGGCQILTGEDGMDGFFYAPVSKTAGRG